MVNIHHQIDHFSYSLNQEEIILSVCASIFSPWK